MRPRYSLLLAATAIVTLLGAPRADAGTAGHAPVPANRTTTAAPFEMLQLGSTGDRVRQVQTRLGGLGYGVVADGAFGPKTRRAVISFQTSKRLRPDGKVGSVTWKALGLDPSDPPTTTTTLPTGIPAGSYHHPSPNVERWHAAALAAGWPDSLWKRLSCVMYRESGGLPNLDPFRGPRTPGHHLEFSLHLDGRHLGPVVRRPHQPAHRLQDVRDRRQLEPLALDRQALLTLSALTRLFFGWCSSSTSPSASSSGGR